MDNLFSHPDPGMQPTPGPLEILDPVINSVVVPATVAHAFLGFTDHTHLWWPLEKHAVFGPGSHVEFEENLILETAEDGRTAVWGTIDDWQPPLSFHASWYPGSTALWSTELRVAFRAVDGGTEVRVVHDGWEGAEKPSAIRAEYDAGWPLVLASYVRFMGGSPEAAEGQA
ncbi:SRPBCC domain-containing protein [Arthrobacter sp. M4]|uniref:SRPBCC domain-containing protein n=1 Tax=Arthrobacter sp. M4 TaxID=218160 RepID=UPI001CDBBD8F|nr:SRPBCC domain-containing protein [Arthrobacter sp. M4]MCA4133757.1 SRPBCC domain-containing protein [Arthrobacter sp. M4]